MKKFALLAITAGFMSIGSIAQSVQEKIEKQSKDPKTAENAAKADVFISKNKSIFDSTTNATGTKSSKASTGKKKKKCSKKA